MSPSIHRPGTRRRHCAFLLRPNCVDRRPWNCRRFVARGAAVLARRSPRSRHRRGPAEGERATASQVHHRGEGLCGTSPWRPISRPSRRGLCGRRPNVAVRAPLSPSLFRPASPVLRSATPLPPSSLVWSWCFSWRFGGREAEPLSRGATVVCRRSARRLCRRRPPLESLPFW